MKVLEVDRITKIYQKGKIGSGSLSKELEAGIKNLLGFKVDTLKLNDKALNKSLDNVSFEVEEGTRLGIIGKNGAGKSTLLKIISKITTPTSGRIKGIGRVSSLLEVGTGFHPELTGLENIYLNGSILGMKKSEIKANLESIVAFSGVESYINTPVKRYSSGMYVRLAFSIAAHLESEILIVDEVLAVGDFEFQRMCLDKMKELSLNQGKTILFVSHNLNSVINLCDKALILDSGKLLEFGDAEEVINNYLNVQKNFTPLEFRVDRKGNQKAKFKQVKVFSPNYSLISSGKTLLVDVYVFSYFEKTIDVDISIGINNSEGIRLTLLNNTLINQKCHLNRGSNCFTFSVSDCPLPFGNYPCTLFLSNNGEILDWVNEAFFIEVFGESFYDGGNSIQKGQGLFYLPFSLKKSEKPN